MQTEMQSAHQQATIQDLPLEVLLEIFDYLPKNEFKNLALVSKIFYGAICELEKFKYPLEISPYILVNPELLEGLLCSSRRFNYIIIKDCLRPEYHKDLFTLLDRHGSAIIKMKLESETFKANASKICMKIFMKAPHLKELTLDIVNLNIIGNDSGLEILPELQILTIKCVESDFRALSNSLRPNSIKKLTVKSHWNGFDEFVNRQLAITDLNIQESNFTQSFEHHKLENFKIFVVEHRTNQMNGIHYHGIYSRFYGTPKIMDRTLNLMVKLINAHPQLKSFGAYKKSSSTLEHAALRGDVIKALCHLSSLEKLTIVAGYPFNIDVSDFAQCSANEVHYDGTYNYGNSDMMSNILSMKNLQTLTVERLSYINFNNIAKSTTIRYLNLINQTKIEINEILKTFDGLESLIVSGNNSIAFLHFTKDDDVFYPHLKFLKFEAIRCPGSFTNFLDHVPNLRTFSTEDSEIRYNMKNMKKLAAMPYLKELKISFEVTSHKSDAAKTLKALKKLCQNVEKFKIFFSGKIDDLSIALTREFSKKHKVHEATENESRGWMLRNY